MSAPPRPDLVAAWRDHGHLLGPLFFANDLGPTRIHEITGLDMRGATSLKRALHENAHWLERTRPGWRGQRDVPPPVERDPEPTRERARQAGAPELRWDSEQYQGDRDQDHDFRYDGDDTLHTIEELIALRAQRYERLRTAKKANEIRRVALPTGPFAIAHFGDPHLDDDGCDWPELQRAVKCVASTPGMYAGNIGDTTNNWVGRLERLYGEQGATYSEGLQLAEWFMRSMPFAYFVLGNHDVWNKGGHLLRALLRGARVAVIADTEAKLELVAGQAAPVRIHARHDFPGTSIWNRAHGVTRAAKMEPWGDLYVAGHRHVWAVHKEEGTDGTPRTGILCRGFKRFDHYAVEKGFQEHEHGMVVVTVHDPTKPVHRRLLGEYLDVEEGADVLSFYRRRGA